MLTLIFSLHQSMAMTKPDLELIAQVMLFSQGFRSAETLASKVVPFFNLCSEQLSPQPHYDFGLRALKAVLVSAGYLKRDRLVAQRKSLADGELSADASGGLAEQEILIQSVIETIVPKLVADDVPLLMRWAAVCFFMVFSCSLIRPTPLLAPPLLSFHFQPPRRRLSRC